MECFYCKETIADDAEVCRYCGARRYESRKSFDWYPPGESPSKRTLLLVVLPIVVLIAAVAMAVMINDNAMDNSREKAQRERDCLKLTGSTDC